MNAPQTPVEPRLTSLSHGGGCGCKIAPGVLSEILKGTAAMPMPKELLVGIETADDAAVYQINAEQALIATTDFFMPIVDDPYDFGRIAATNAISDVYAMGGRPILALALVGMPINVLSTATIGRILEGGACVCREAGIPLLLLEYDLSDTRIVSHASMKEQVDHFMENVMKAPRPSH